MLPSSGRQNVVVNSSRAGNTSGENNKNYNYENKKHHLFTIDRWAARRPHRLHDGARGQGGGQRKSSETRSAGQNHEGRGRENGPRESAGRHDQGRRA